MTNFEKRYAHITSNKKIEIEITEKQMAAILYAQNFGLKAMDKEAIAVLDTVMDTLTYKLHP